MIQRLFAKIFSHPRLQPTPPGSGRHHAATFVRVGGWEAEIDLGIAPLIEALWTLGVETDNSCENSNEGGYALITLSNTTALELFVRIAAAALDERMQIRAFRGAWQWSVTPVRDGDRILVMPKIFVPIHDVPALTQALRQHAGLEAPVAAGQA